MTAKTKQTSKGRTKKAPTITKHGKRMGRPFKYDRSIPRIQRTVHLSEELWKRIDAESESLGEYGRTIVIEIKLREMFGMPPLPLETDEEEDDEKEETEEVAEQ